MKRTLQPLLAVLLVSTVGFLGCGSSPKTVPAATSNCPPLPDAEDISLPWLPWKARTTWTYESRKSGGATVRTGLVLVSSGEEGRALETYVGSTQRSRMRVWVEDGAVQSEGGLLIPSSPEPGMTWEIPAGRARVVGQEEVFVPAYGQSLEAVRIEYRRTWHAGQQEVGAAIDRWWRRGVGIVRERRDYVPEEWTAWDPAARKLWDELVVKIPDRLKNRLSRLKRDPTSDVGKSDTKRAEEIRVLLSTPTGEAVESQLLSWK